VAGLIYNPILDEMYTAEKGQGAFVNSRRLRVAARKSLADSVVAIGIPHRGRDGHSRFLSECKLLMTQAAGIRRTGSAATDLSWVAAGRLDGYLDYSLGAWDIAAGALLVREAGGHVTDSKGDHKMYETKSIVAGNATIHKALLGVVAEAQNAS
jgi:myo-inositol-1(or 4)-monophosphatase